MNGDGIGDIFKKLKGLFSKAKKVGDVAGAVYDSSVGSAVRNMIPDSDENARPGFPGERHAMLKLPNGKMGVGNYIGPGTNLAARLKRGDPPRTAVDEVAKAHDIRYGLASTEDDISAADDKMLRAVKGIADRKGDSRFNIAQANLIKLKKYGESLGVLKRDAFSGDLSKNAELPTSDIAAMKTALVPLEQKGYGKKAPPKPKDPAYRLRKRLAKAEGNSGANDHEAAAKFLPKLIKMHGSTKKIDTATKNNLVKSLAKGLKKARKAGAVGMSGSGFFSSFASKFKRILGGPLGKVAAAGLSFVNPALGAALGGASALAAAN